MTKAIKNVSDETWREFKAIASIRNMTMGELFEEMVGNLKKEKPNKWLDEIAKNPLLTDADDVRRRVKKFRKEFTLDREGCT